MVSHFRDRPAEIVTLTGEEQPQRGPSSGSTVLVVDDIAANARLLQRLLIRDGHHVLFAQDGEEALERVRRDHPDLVIMDVIMPTLDGFETCRRLKSDPDTRLVPVVLITALQGSRERVRGLEVGADDFLSRPVNTAELTARVRSLLRIKRFTDELDSAESVILSLALTIEARDSKTDGHCQRLARYSVTVGRQLNLNDDDLGALAKGGYLHDVGKVGIPDSILNKPSRLTPDEWEIMRQHPIIGDKLCGELRSLRRVRPIVRYHHERLDGSGYPEGLRGQAIPLLAQLLSVVDVFDALTTARSYKPALTPEAAYQVLTREVERGWRNPEIVDVLISLGRSGQLLPLTAEDAPSSAFDPRDEDYRVAPEDGAQPR